MDIRSCNESEVNLVNLILAAATVEIKRQFDSSETPGEIKEFLIPKTKIVKDAQEESGATLTPKVRVHLIDQAKAHGFKLNPLGGDKGNHLVFAFGRKGRPKGSTNKPKVPGETPETSPVTNVANAK